MPLLHLSPPPVPLPLPPSDPFPSRKSWYSFLPLLLAVLLLLLPHPSYALILVSHYLAAHHAPLRFALNLVVVHTLTLLALTSLMICAVRDPGDIRRGGSADIAAKSGVMAPLLPDDASADSDDHADPIHWCAHCRHIRPERAHHCSTCARCILKMDHHCPWLGGNCIGHRTYPAFLHFLLTTTLLAGYIASVALVVTIDLIREPFTTTPRVSPLHALFLLLAGAVFTLTMASFLAYHLFLVSTNQTTLEHISPFLLLRYLPAHSPDNDPTFSDSVHDAEPASPASTVLHHLPSPDSASATAHRPGPYRPPSEEALSRAQRHLVQHAHGRIRPYDLGFWRNWGAVLGPGRCRASDAADGGGRRLWRWVRWGGLLVLCGGHSRGDGWTYERGEGVAGKLEGLRKRLEDVGRVERRSVI